MIECKTGENYAADLNGHMNEEVVCELMQCLDTHFVQLPSKSTCEYGEWTNQLTCSPKNDTCPSANVPEITNGTLQCDENDQDKATGDYLGGSVCPLTCESGYLQTGQVQCINSQDVDSK